MSRTVISTPINEGTTPYLTFTIIDRAGVGFKPETLTLTLYNYRDGAIINSRNAQNVLDTNGCATSSGGLTTFQLVEADTPIVLPDSGDEVHIAYFRWTWNSGAFVGSHEVELHVQNLSKQL